MPLSPHTLKQNAKTITVAAVFAFFAGAYMQSQIRSGVNGLRADINAFAMQACRANPSAAALGKYNDVVTTLIEQQQEAEVINETAGDTKRAELNAATIAKLQDDRIAVPKQDCSTPILPPK